MKDSKKIQIFTYSAITVKIADKSSLLPEKHGLFIFQSKNLVHAIFDSVRQ